MIQTPNALWKLRRVKTFTTKIGSGKTPSGGGESYKDEGIIFLRSQNIHFDGLKLDDVVYIDHEIDHEMQASRVRNGDVLVNITGASLGRVTYVPDGFGKANVNQHVCVVRPSKDADTRFLAYTLSSLNAQEQIFSLQVGGNRDGLNFEQLGNIKLPLPSLREQCRIADFLDAETNRIDCLSQLRRQQIESLADRYRTAMSELVTPGVSAAGERNRDWPWLPSEIPVARLGYFARIQSGVTVDGSRVADSEEIEAPYLRVANVQGEDIDLSEIKRIRISTSLAKRALLKDGDVVMTEANGNPDNLGRGAVWRGQIPGMIHQNHIFAIRVDVARLLPEFLSALLASFHGRRYFRFTASQVGIATTSSSKVLSMPIPIVSLPDQAGIAAECARMRTSVEQTSSALRRQLALLAERRQALITAAVTGQIDVTTARGVEVS